MKRTMQYCNAALQHARAGAIAAYFFAVQRRAAVTLAVLVLLVAVLGAFVPRLALDASADSLVLESDRALQYYRDTRARYGTDDFLVVTYQPTGELFARPTLDRIASLETDLAQLERVASVKSLLDVPLLKGRSFSDLQDGTSTLRSREVDLAAARQDFTANPLYRNVLVGDGTKIAGLYVYFRRDPHYQDLLDRRNALRETRLQRDLSDEERRQLAALSRQVRAHNAKASVQLREDVASVRAILDRYRDHATIHLAGVPMIVADMIRFIEHDLRVFGAAVLGFIVVLLAISFRRPHWIAIPVLICLAAALAMLGGLGLVGKPLTVVSSNFLPVLLIVTLSLTVHLIVRHQELSELHPRKQAQQIIAQTMRDKFAPCLYTALTTMVAFGSLTVSGIRPVIDFGWLLVTGIACAFVLVFFAFPASLALAPAPRLVERRFDVTGRVTGFLARLIDRRAAPTLTVAAILFMLGAAGMTRLSVENRFIDYFGASTEIHQGMVTIDRELGGTTPLDVIINAPAKFLEENSETHGDNGLGESARAGLIGTSYWFNAFRLDRIKRIHDYLDDLPETGKVLSLATSIRLMEELNGGQPLNNLTLVLVHKKMPADIEKRLLEPYLSDDGNQLRFSIRIYESNPGLERDSLLRRIQADLIQQFDLEPQQVQLTGMTVLYNNMLQSLYRSQVLTFGFVIIAVFLMFLALFRSVLASAIALVPNLLVAALVLGLMGWLNISLDIMTITIAAIAMGIGVDDTIHYMHRFRTELAGDGDEWAAMRRSHRSIGRAIFYTSITITLGFSILVLSDFVPTITFGLLTGAAMMAALVADLTVLPVLLAVCRPFGRAGRSA